MTLPNPLVRAMAQQVAEVDANPDAVSPTMLAYTNEYRRYIGRSTEQPRKRIAGRKREPHALQKARKVVYERSGGRCEAATPVCAGPAVHVHHVAGRVGEDAHAPENLLHVSLECHAWIHSHPEESTERGWLRSRLGTVRP